MIGAVPVEERQRNQRRLLNREALVLAWLVLVRDLRERGKEDYCFCLGRKELRDLEGERSTFASERLVLNLISRRKRGPVHRLFC